MVASYYFFIVEKFLLQEMYIYGVHLLVGQILSKFPEIERIIFVRYHSFQFDFVEKAVENP